MPANDSPRRPVASLTTYDLRTYRRALERSLKGISPDAPVCERLRSRLAEVRSEEESRAQLKVALA